MAIYHAFGLNIGSETPLPELGLARPGAKPDILIRRVDPDRAPEMANIDRALRAAGGTVAFRVPGTAAFRIRSGGSIDYCPEPGGDADKIRLYLLGTCMGALLLQRQILPLHGSVIELSGKAYAIVGDSGAGKSTLTSVLLDRGCRLLSDDVAAVTFDGEGRPIAHAAYPQQKLWQESLSKLGLDRPGLRPLFERETKFAVPAHDRFCGAATPLAGIFELTKSDDDSAEARVEARGIAGLGRLHLLYRHTFRHTLIEPLGLTGWHFDASARLSGRVRMMQLKRPPSAFTAHALADLILTHAEEEIGHDRQTGTVIHRFA